MKDHMYYDPFIEHDELQKRFIAMDEENVRFRRTKMMFEIISSEYRTGEAKASLRFNVRKGGNIEIRAACPSDYKKATSHRCDLGHHHPIIMRETRHFDILDLDRDEAQALKDFLNETLP